MLSESAGWALRPVVDSGPDFYFSIPNWNRFEPTSEIAFSSLPSWENFLLDLGGDEEF